MSNMLFSPDVNYQRVTSVAFSLTQDNLFSLSGKTSHSSLEKTDDFTQLLEALKFADDFKARNPNVLLYIPANLNKNSVVINTLTSILRCRLETSKDWVVNRKELESKGETIWTKTNCFGNDIVQLEFNKMLEELEISENSFQDLSLDMLCQAIIDGSLKIPEIPKDDIIEK